MTSSSAKLPLHNSENSKFVTVSFTKIKREDIEGGDFVRKDYPKNSTEKEKKIINDKYKNSIDNLQKDNDILYDALNIIAEEFEILFNKEKTKKEYFAYPYIAKSDVRKPYQDTVNGENGEFKLENKIFRVRLDVVKRDERFPETNKYHNRIGFFKQRDRTFNNTVFKKKNEPVIRIKEENGQKKRIYLNTENIGEFITYKSRVSGEIDFSNSSSCKEHSMTFKFTRLYVKTHKSNIKQNLHSEEELKELHDNDDGFKDLSDDSDDAPDIEKLQEENKENTNNEESNSSSSSDSEPGENDSSDDETIQKKPKQIKL